MSNSVWPHRQQPTRLPHPWDSPVKHTGVGCHFLLQCMKVKSESEVAQLCLTLSDPMDCSLPGSSTHGIFQARVPEWAAIAFSLPYVWQSGNMWAETMACYYEWKPVMIQVTLHQKKKNEIGPQWWEVLCNMGKLPKRPWVSPPMQHAGGRKRKIWLYFVRFLQNPFRVPVSLFVPLKLEVMVR